MEIESHYYWYIAYRYDVGQSHQGGVELLGRAWDRGFVNRKIQAKKLQIDNESQLDKIRGTVRLTQTVKLKSGQTQRVKTLSNHP